MFFQHLYSITMNNNLYLSFSLKYGLFNPRSVVGRGDRPTIACCGVVGRLDRPITKRSDIFVNSHLMNANAFAMTTLMLFSTNVNISLNLSSTSGSFLYVNNNMRRSFECQKSAVLTDRKFRKSIKYYNIYL